MTEVTPKADGFIGQPKTMYLHVRGKRPRVVTLVHTLGKDERGQLFGHIGYSICNLDFDLFNKKIGRKIAEGRMFCARTMLVVNYPADATTWSARMSFLLETLAGAENPKRLAKPVAMFLSQQNPASA